MSLAALLLGLPAKVFKLRGHNAPVVPFTSLRGPVHSIYQTVNSDLDEPHTWSHSLAVIGQNNAVQTSTEVCSLSGKGAIDGAWIRTHNANSSNPYTFSYGIEIIVDGQDIIPAGWRHEKSVMSEGTMLVSSPVGGCGFAVNLFSNTFRNRAVFERASAPIPFKSSLVINLIHYSSAATTFLKTNVHVNAWLTE